MVVNSFSRSCSEIVNKLQFLERVYTQEFEDNVEYDEVLEIQTLLGWCDDHDKNHAEVTTIEIVKTNTIMQKRLKLEPIKWTH